MTRRVMTAAEKRAERFWPPVAGLLIIGGWLLVAAIEGGAIHV